MNKPFTLLLILTVCTMLTACQIEQTTIENSGDTVAQSTDHAPVTHVTTTLPDQPKPPATLPKNVFARYDNLVGFHQVTNDKVAFIIHENDSTIHWSACGQWHGTYRFGYMDWEGTILSDELYECCYRFCEINSPANNYVKVNRYSVEPQIVDLFGNVHFQQRWNGISNIGDASNGYFWIETTKLTVNGTVCAVTYYSSMDKSVVATIENVKADTEGGYSSDINEYGIGTVTSLENNQHIEIDISEYDPSFQKPSDVWNVDLSSLEAFKGMTVSAYAVSQSNNSVGRVATVLLENADGNYSFATVDATGKVLMAPQTAINFCYSVKQFNEDGEHVSNGFVPYAYSHDLCPARDMTSGLWGYINSEGEWVIQPAYTSATEFFEDGYAVVNSKVIIDTDGKTVLSPEGCENTIVTKLSGQYKFEFPHGDYMTITFNEDGSGTYRENVTGYRMESYTLLGSTIQLNGKRSFMYFINRGVEYSFAVEGENIIIDGFMFKPVK